MKTLTKLRRLPDGSLEHYTESALTTAQVYRQQLVESNDAGLVDFIQVKSVAHGADKEGNAVSRLV